MIQSVYKLLKNRKCTSCMYDINDLPTIHVLLIISVILPVLLVFPIPTIPKPWHFILQQIDWFLDERILYVCNWIFQHPSTAVHVILSIPFSLCVSLNNGCFAAIHILRPIFTNGVLVYLYKLTRLTSSGVVSYRSRFTIVIIDLSLVWAVTPGRPFRP